MPGLTSIIRGGSKVRGFSTVPTSPARPAWRLWRFDDVEAAVAVTELKIDIAAMSNVRLNLIFAAQRRSKRLGGTRNDAALASAAVATRSDGRCSWVSSRAPIGARLSKCVIADLP
jgi:hypothetical protein